MRRFNTTGLCVPRKHYMVDVSGRVAQMRVMVDAGDYFCVNRPRQYGKTTLLAALERSLAEAYEVASFSFQRLSYADFASEAAFVRALCRNVPKACRTFPAPVAERMSEVARDRQVEWVMGDLFDLFEEWVEQSGQPVVLIIDEVDSATSNQVFLDFLARLRDQYLLHEKDPSNPAFQSVILAGANDVKYLEA
ncbi:MAG: AAA-like domain-containing protein [Atopobiaceae bacterium]|nr:AAA-like domain-containing protein [Atopobiaceae bacterium]